MVAPGPEVELIPPGRSARQRIAPPEPATRDLQALQALEITMLPLTALSIGLGAAMMPVFAMMFVTLVPVRWMFGEPARR